MADAYERKLRPIYDAIDNQNHKTAIKLSTSALSKYKDDQLLRALRAWSQLKFGRHEEAKSEFEKLAEEPITDEGVLNVCGLYLQQSGQGSKLTALTAAACEARPKDVKLHQALFGAYVRELDFKKQQQVALKLQRLDKQSAGQYAWWAIVSVVLQAKAAKQGSASGMSSQQLMQLAEGMAEKRIAIGGADEGQEAVLLYLEILAEQGKQKKAAELLNQDLGKAISMTFQKSHVRARLLIEGGDLKGAMEVCSQRWKEHQEDWQIWELLLDCCFPPDNSLQKIEEEKVPEFMWAVRLVEEDFKEIPLEARTSRERGVVFAKLGLELRRFRLQQAEADTCWQEDATIFRKEVGRRLAEAVAAGFSFLGHTMSCAQDFGRYTSQLNPEKQQWAVSQIMASVRPILETSKSELALGDLRRIVNALKIENDLGLPAFKDAETAASHAKEMSQLFWAAQHLYKGLDRKDRGPADELPIIAVSNLLTAYKLEAERSPKWLLQAVLLLEAVQQQREVSAGLRIASAAIFSLLGAPSLAAEHLRRLDLKHVQLETVSSHLQLPVMLASLRVEDAEKLLQRTCSFYEDHLQDFGNTTLMAYTHRNYTKAIELSDFRQRLEISFTRAVCSVERSSLRASIAALKGRVQLRDCFDRCKQDLDLNRTHLWQRTGTDDSAGGLGFYQDLSVRPAWLPPSAWGPSLALADWWLHADAADNAEDNKRWWLKKKGTSSGADAQLESFRRETLTHLRRQALVLELLRSFLGRSDDRRDSCFQEAFERLLVLEETTQEALDVWMARLPERLRGLPLPRVCQQLDTALFAIIAAAKESGETDVSKRTSALCDSLAAASERIATELRPEQGGLLCFGAGWVVAAQFLHSLTWVAAFLDAILPDLLPADGGKKGKKGKLQACNGVGSFQAAAGGGSSAALQKSSLASFHMEPAAAAGLTAAFEAAVATVQSVLQNHAPDLPGIARQLEEQLAPRKELWSQELSFDAVLLLERVVQDQNDFFGRFRDVLDAALSLIASRATSLVGTS